MRCLGALSQGQIRDFRLSTLVDSNCSCYEPATMGGLRADKVRCFGASLDSASSVQVTSSTPMASFDSHATTAAVPGGWSEP